MSLIKIEKSIVKPSNKLSKTAQLKNIVLGSDATAIVKDQNDNTLATETIPSGGTKEIIINKGEEVLYTYNYLALNTGQDVSYATGDDKDIKDTVFNPEIATWDTSLKWVFPVLDPNDFTKLLRGSNPDGSGNNIFGNKERFTDENGLQVYENDYYIDHFTGEGIFTNKTLTSYNFLQSLDYANNLSGAGFNDYHWCNHLELTSIMNAQQISESVLNYPPFNISSNQETRTSTSTFRGDFPTENTRIFSNAYLLTVINKETSSLCLNIAFRKAFTYNPTTKQMELS